VFRILVKKTLGENVSLFEIDAPRVARRHRAGQFVMVRPHASSERIPLTIADVNREAGTITLVVQAVGKTTIEMTEAFAEGDSFANVAGPLGNPTHIEIPGRPEDFRGTVACVAGGIGAAPMLPIARAFREAAGACMERRDVEPPSDSLGTRVVLRLFLEPGAEVPVVTEKQHAIATVGERQCEFEGEERLPRASGTFDKNALVLQEPQQSSSLVEGYLNDAIVLSTHLSTSAAKQAQLRH